jgi:hypothetical protein
MTLVDQIIDNKPLQIGLIIADSVNPTILVKAWRKPSDLPGQLYRNKECTSAFRPGELVTWAYYRTWMNEPHYGQYDYVLNQYIN